MSAIGSLNQSFVQYENEIRSQNPVREELYQADPKENTEDNSRIKKEKEIDPREKLVSTAIENDNDEDLRILFDSGVKVGGLLFTAVRMNAFKCVKTIVKIIQKRNRDEEDVKNTKKRNDEENVKIIKKRNDVDDVVGQEKTEDKDFITPLMMALQLSYYDIVEYFIAEGYKIEEPKTADEEIKKSEIYQHGVVFKFNTYQAIANPIYICYMFIHNKIEVNPLFEIFRLNQVLLKQSRVYAEFREYYKEESKKCEDFAVDLMEQCRTFEEIKMLTNVIPELEKEKYIQIENKGARNLTFLNLAIRDGNEKLVAHPYSQLCLNMALHKNIYTIFCFEPNWRDRSLLSMLAYTFRHILLVPFFTLIYIIAPCRENISKYFESPMIKFMNHIWSTLSFVALLILSAFQDTFNKDIMKPSIPDWIILVWIIGMIFQEFKELWIQGKRRYFGQWWNAVTFLMMAFFVASYSLRLIAYGITGNWAVLDPIKDFGLSSWYQTILLANSLFSIGMVLSFIRLSGVLQANDVFGPLQLSLYHLILDVFKFMVFFVLIFLAFGLSLRKLYSHYISTQQYIAEQRKAMNSTEHETDHHFLNVASGLYGLFWSLFGLTDLQNFSTKDKNFAITKETGELLFGIFQVLAVIVAINMLIAMMTRSFDKIASNAIKKWKVSRTSLWMFWVEKGSILPPPLNLIPNVYYIVGKLQKRYKCCAKESEESGQSSKSADERNRLLKDILKRYIATRKIADNVYPRDDERRR